MSLFSVLKTNSKRALREHWGTAICALLIFAGARGLLWVMQGTVIELFVDTAALDPTLAIHYGFNEYFLQQFAAASLREMLVVLIFGVVGFFLLSPLRLGITRWNYELVQGNPSSLSEMFRYFESRRRYGRSLWLELHLSVRCFLWALLFYTIPAAIFSVSTAAIIYGDPYSTVGAFASVGVLLAGGLALLATVFYFATINRYVLAHYLISESDETDVRTAIKQSVQYTKGYRFSFLWYELSFFGWLLLCVAIIPALYVGPYINASFAMYAKYIIEKGRFTPENPTREFRPVDERDTVVEERLAEDPPIPAPPPEPPSQDDQTDMEREPVTPQWQQSQAVIDDFQFPRSQYPPDGYGQQSEQEGDEQPSTAPCQEQGELGDSAPNRDEISQQQDGQEED